MPKPEDIASLAADYSGGNIGSHAGVARAGVLLSLAATDPGYIKDMIQPLSDTSYAVRLYDLNEQTGDFNAVNVRVDSNEILLDAGRFKSGSPMWWSVILRAGQELDQYLGYQATTTLAGDSSDNAAPVRQGIGSVVGAHTETVSMDEYATLSNLEVSRGILSSNATVALYYARTSLSTSLMQAKNDNWPAYIDLLRDKRNIGLVRLHDVSDLQHIASDGVVHAPSGASITLLGHNSGASNRMSIAVPGQDSVTVDSGFWSKLIVTGMEKNAVWLQPGFDYVVRDPLAAQYKPFKMPLDLLQLATAELSLTRRSCESDAAFVQLPSSTF